ITVTCIATVPDLGGVPPSTAVRINVSCFCCSRSNSLSNTNSTFLRKCSLFCITYDCTEFIPISAS
uniref:Uncharacterized protein n=1 Tax=Cyprinus carpio TaxID=7962 RepID=A0A8C1ZNB3_CYPCA